MKNLLIRLSLYSAIALVPIGCASRKVNTDINKNKTVQDTKTKESVQTSEGKTTSNTEAKNSQETNNSEGATTTNVKKYDKDTGKLIEERITVSNKKKSGTKQASETKHFEETQYHLVNMERTITTHVIVKEYSKQKQSSTNNVMLIIAGLLVVGGLGFGVWKWVNR